MTIPSKSVSFWKKFPRKMQQFAFFEKKCSVKIALYTMFLASSHPSLSALRAINMTPSVATPANLKVVGNKTRDQKTRLLLIRFWSRHPIPHHYWAPSCREIASSIISRDTYGVFARVFTIIVVGAVSRGAIQKRTQKEGGGGCPRQVSCLLRNLPSSLLWS